MFHQNKLPFCPNLPDIEFNGPLDVLLHLVRGNKVELQEINLSLITSQYIEWLKLQKFKSLNLAYSYLVMAATLLELKSRALIPHTPNDELEGTSSIDTSELANSPAELARRIAAYASLQEIIEGFKTRLAYAQAHHSRGGIKPIEKREFVLSEMSVHHLIFALDRTINRQVKKKPITVTRPSISLPRILKELRHWMNYQKEGAPLQELLFMTDDLPMFISYFIGTLDLVNRGEWQISKKQSDFWLKRKQNISQNESQNLQFNL